MNFQQLKILLIEDDAVDAAFIQRTIKHGILSASQITRAHTLSEGVAIVGQDNFDAVLLDLGLPDSWGLETLAQLLPHCGTCPVVVLTGLEDQDTAALAVQSGAQDYLSKGNITAESLQRSLRYAIERMHHVEALSAKTRQIQVALREKELLLKEIHHRVKNNMQVISSLLKLQGQYVEDPVARALFRQCDDRVRSMALIHERLYRSEGLAEIDFSSYLQDLAGALLRSYSVNARKVEIKPDLHPVLVGIDQAVPCGLLLSEIISNALKHAFDPESGGVLELALREQNGRIKLSVADNGRGLPPDFDLHKRTTLGFEIIHTLTEQLSGKLTVESAQGTTFILEFERQAPSKPLAA